MRRYVIVGGEPELAPLLHIFPEGVEELDGAFAVYADEPPIGFDVLEVEDVREGWETSGARSITASPSAASGSGRPGNCRRQFPVSRRASAAWPAMLTAIARSRRPA